MRTDTPMVTIFGGSGFVGRYVARRMAKAGWRVRVAVRRPNEALFVRTYGVVGQVEPVLANIRNAESVRRAIQGAQAVVNCVGILLPAGKQTFDAVQNDGAGTIAKIAAEEGVARLVHVSSIGADADSESQYMKSKAAGEARVLAAFPTAVILRPSIMFGTEDQFFNKFGFVSRISPVLPVVGGSTLFQPVFVDDVAAAAQKAVLGDATPGIYELGGPEVASFRELLNRLLQIVRRKRLIFDLPMWLARIYGRMFDVAYKMSASLLPVPFSYDQVILLQKDNVVSQGARGLADLGIEPTPMATILPTYLYSFRPYGQYSEITASARNMRG